MNITTILLGVAAILFGGYTFYLRRTNPEKFDKLTSMKKTYGERRGVAIHVLFYSIVPILIGIVLIIIGA